MPGGYNPYQQNPYQRQSQYQQNQRQRQNPYMQNQYAQNQMNRQMMPYRQQTSQQMPRQMPMMGQQQMPQQMPMMGQQQMPQQMPMMGQQQMPQQLPQDPMVSYEPLDEKTLNEIKAGLAKSETASEPVGEKTTTVYALDKSLIEKIGGFVQNERNSSYYYKNLSEKAHNGRSKEIILKIGEANHKQIASYQDIYKTFTGNEFEVREADVISNVDFYEGVGLAILEESMLLDELNDICETLPDDKSVKIISRMINRKVSVINNLRNLQSRIGL